MKTAVKLDWYKLFGFSKLDHKSWPLSEEVEVRIKSLIRERAALFANSDYLGRELALVQEEREELRKQLVALIEARKYPVHEAKAKGVVKTLLKIGADIFKGPA